MSEAPEKLKRYYRTQMPREKIAEMLSDPNSGGSMSIHGILDWYNTKYKHGLTMPQLSNILSGDPRFEETGEKVTVCSLLGNRYKSTVWKVAGCLN